MARRTPPVPGPSVPERIVDIDVAEEMRGSFLEYAYSVIYSRALPDARDGLKPVQRRILYTMSDMGLRPDRGHVKSARVVGEVMGRLHPHGDNAIYDALVRMAQDFSLRLPLVDGHGNFGSLDDGPAAYRYTEARMGSAALAMVGGLDEDVVDFGPNYDGRESEPTVLPAAFPNLLVNGASGIAVGMATNMAPHNLGEVVAAARHLLAHPGAGLDELMRFVPGPDLPTGGRIIGLDGIRDAYETGRGTFRMRATVRVEQITPRRKGLVVTELPWNVGPEKVIEKIRDLYNAKKITGIADVTDLTDADHGLNLVIELKAGFVPEAVLEQLYRMTPLEETFGINNVCLVQGQPRTLGLKGLLEVFLEHRLEVVRRRSEFRRRTASDRLHLVEGLLLAILDIDEVIAVIRSSDDAAAARERLMSVFDLSEVQANYILDMPLRRLTKFSTIELEKERTELQTSIAELTALLENPAKLRAAVSAELADVVKKHGTPRRTVLLEGSGQPTRKQPAIVAEVGDDPCLVLLSGTGLVARTTSASRPPGKGPRGVHDVIVASARATTRGDVGLVTSKGRMLRLPVLELPAIPPTHDAPTLAGGAPLGAFISIGPDERVVGMTSLLDGPGLALGTRNGVVKRVAVDVPANKDEWDVIRLENDDEVVGAAELSTGTEALVFITRSAQLLTYSASAVRPQGRAAAGMAGIRLEPGDHVLHFGAVGAPEDAVVVTIAGADGMLIGTQSSAKVSPFEEYPTKGRATGGVRAHRFLKGEDHLELAWVGAAPARAADIAGAPIDLPVIDPRRDASGSPTTGGIESIAGAITAGDPPVAEGPSGDQGNPSDAEPEG